MPWDPKHAIGGSSCEHDFRHLGLQWWNDDAPRPGSGATTIRYVHAFYCVRCCETRTEDAAFSHDSYTKLHADALPVSAADAMKLRKKR